MMSSLKIPELSDCNHFEFGYNQIAFNTRQKESDHWWVRYGRSKKQPLNFGRECLRTAKLIRQKTSLPIQVLFSGGVDSEVALKSFVGAKIPVEAAVLKFKHDLNLHDISWAIRTCEEFAIPYRIFELDILKFWENDALQFADATSCVSPQLLSTMWLVNQVEGYPVLGSGECLLVRRDAPPPGEPERSSYGEETWELYEKEKIASWYRHFIICHRDGCPGFFQYTPEIMLAYLWDPMIWDLCHNNLYGKYTTASIKLLAYQRHFRSLQPRPKYTGFENVMEQDAKFRSFLKKRYPGCDQVVKTSFQDLVQTLIPKDGDPTQIVTTIR